MTFQRLAWWALVLAGPALALGKPAWRAYDAHQDERAVEVAVMNRFDGGASGARVVEIDSNKYAVCGWVVPGQGQAALAFHSLRPGRGFEARPNIPLRNVGGAVDRARAARMGDVVRRSCGSILPPPPAAAFKDPETDQALNELDRIGTDWVVVQPAGTTEFVALGRRGAGSKSAFPTRKAAEDWVADQRFRDNLEIDAFRQCYAMQPSAAQDACLRRARATAPRSATS